VVDYIAEVGEWMSGTGRHRRQAQKWSDDPTVAPRLKRDIDTQVLARKISDAAPRP